MRKSFLVTKIREIRDQAISTIEILLSILKQNLNVIENTTPKSVASTDSQETWAGWAVSKTLNIAKQKIEEGMFLEKKSSSDPPKNQSDNCN
jgi:hypothetical protein